MAFTPERSEIDADRVNPCGPEDVLVSEIEGLVVSTIIVLVSLSLKFPRESFAVAFM